MENLAGNQFVNFAVVAFTELPTVFLGEYFINRLGRRWTHVGCMILATLFFAAIIPIANGMVYKNQYIRTHVKFMC